MDGEGYLSQRMRLSIHDAKLSIQIIADKYIQEFPEISTGLILKKLCHHYGKIDTKSEKFIMLNKIQSDNSIRKYFTYNINRLPLSIGNCEIFIENI